MRSCSNDHLCQMESIVKPYFLIVSRSGQSHAFLSIHIHKSFHILPLFALWIHPPTGCHIHIRIGDGGIISCCLAKRCHRQEQLIKSTTLTISRYINYFQVEIQEDTRSLSSRLIVSVEMARDGLNLLKRKKK